MIFDGKRLEDITEDDLQYLEDNQIIEKRQLEYKKELTIKSGDEKREFLADVSAFANSAGGYLIYGIEEDEGVPIDLFGIEIASSLDAKVSDIENLMRDGIEPTISGIQVHPITLRNANIAIIIKIPQSWSLPHWVSLRGDRKFYTRHLNGKHVVDIEELRQLFTLRNITQERIRQFRDAQITKIQEGHSPIPLASTPIFVLHIVPFSVANTSANYDLASWYQGQNSRPELPLIGLPMKRLRYNFDGLLARSELYEGEYYGYTQLFRNGAIEVARADSTNISRVQLLNASPEESIPIQSYEIKIRETLPKLVKIQEEIEIPPPFFVMLSLLGVDGYKLAIGGHTFSYDEPIAEKNLIMPESLISDYDFDVDEVLRPIFNIIWNTVGYERSLSFDEDGKWKL
jgi:hypothetical protein